MPGIECPCGLQKLLQGLLWSSFWLHHLSAGPSSSLLIAISALCFQFTLHTVATRALTLKHNLIFTLLLLQSLQRLHHPHDKPQASWPDYRLPVQTPLTSQPHSHTPCLELHASVIISMLFTSLYALFCAFSSPEMFYPHL